MKSKSPTTEKGLTETARLFAFGIGYLEIAWLGK
jgi:hypothetical protein